MHANGELTTVTDAEPGPPTPAHNGYTRIGSNALTSIVRGVLAPELQVEPGQITVLLGDAAGELTVTVTTPVAMPPLTVVRRNRSTPQETLWERILRVRRHLGQVVTDMTGLQVARVDIFLNAAKPLPKRRLS